VGEHALLLEMRGIVKRFPGVLALDDVSIELRQGEILGLVGENGAGKSTLMRILGGIYRADAGDIVVDGRRVEIREPRDALNLGISIIHQELNLAGNLDIASNVFLGREPASTPFKIVRKRQLASDAERLAGRVGLARSTSTLVESLSPGEQQLVEIAKALSMSACILVLDEPTSSLSPGEVERLFSVVRELRDSGVSMIYISHRIAEVEAICERVVVLRDGRNAGQLEGKGIRRDDIVKLMIGRDLSQFFPEATRESARKPVLTVEDLACPGCSGRFNFVAYSGEILGIAGLMGSGRTELIRSIFGIEPPVSGRAKVMGYDGDIRTPSDAICAGIGLVPEDRKNLGLILEMSVRENITLPGIGSYRPPFLDRAREAQVTREQVDSLSIRTPSIEQEVQYLSGGTQQKVALGKWLALAPRVLIMDEPTRGIDVGSKGEIHRLIRALADSGVAVIMVSSEMEEIVGLSDRVLVMHEGCQAGILEGSNISEATIMHLATGGEA